VASYLNVNEKTVRYWRKIYKDTGGVDVEVKSGRKLISSEKELNMIKRLALQHQDNSALQLQSKLKAKGIYLSVSTIRHLLKSSGIYYRSTIQAPLLSEKHIQKRLSWAEEHEETDFSKVLFTDESTFYMERKITKAWQTSDKRFINRTVKHPAKVLALGCFSKNGFGKLFLFTQNLNADYMCYIYGTALLKSVKMLFGAKNDDWYLQEDNDPKHRSKNCTDWKSDHHIKVISWPSQSPDLNPIENVWGLMKMKLQRKKFRNVKHFRREIMKCWKELPNDYAKKLFESMDSRIDRLLSNEGDYINY